MGKFIRVAIFLVGGSVVAGCSPKQIAVKESAPTAQSFAVENESKPGIAPGSVEDFRTNVGDTVQFAYNSYNLDDQAKRILEKQSSWLARYPSVILSIEGHCDERGTREYNLALGARRANAISEYLLSRNIAQGRLGTVSYGKERPVCTAANEDCWAQNRRAVSVPSTGGS